MGDVLLLAFLFLCAGVIAVPLAVRFGLGSVLGYLMAGIAIAPVLDALRVDVVSIQHFAEFGVVVMLFLVGLELAPERLWQMRGRLVGLGGLQVALTVALVSMAAMALGEPWQVALAAGLVLSISSTAIVLQTLNEKGLMKSDGGQASFAVLLFQDIAVIPMLAVLPLLALPGREGGAVDHGTHGADGAGHGGALSLVDGLGAGEQALLTLAAIALVVVGGGLASRPMFRYIAGARLREVFVAGALLWVIATALLMTLVGLSPALGTFVAGVVLANSEYRHELESTLDPVKGLLLGLFFITVGAGIDFAMVASEPARLIGLALGLIAIKAAVLLLLSALFGISGADRWLFALGLAQAGEFGFVLLSFSVTAGAIPAPLAAQLLVAVALSMLATPALFILFDRAIAPRFARGDEPVDEDPVAPSGSIIIAGHGRFGGIVNRLLRGLGHETTVLDYSSAQLEMLRAFGFRVYYGDATRPELLEAAGIERAAILVVAIDGREQITEIVRHVIAEHPHVHVVARAVDRSHVYELWAVGCRDIIRETFDGGVRAARSALEALGMAHEAAEDTARRFVEMDKRAMSALADVYDPDQPIHRNAAYVERAREINARNAALLRGEDPELAAADPGGAPGSLSERGSG